MRAVQIKENRWIGDGHPAYIIAEIGINHNGEVSIAKKLIDAAVKAGCDAVKFQKRTPEIWGKMSYIDYKKRIEFEFDEFSEIDAYCKEKGIDWFASCWDEPSVDFLEQFNPVMYKMASASLTDLPLLTKVRSTGRPLMLSTGMSDMHEIHVAVEHVGLQNLMIAHSTSAYPCDPKELNLKMVRTRNRFSYY
jgi:N-acetylneuraminate synthase